MTSIKYISFQTEQTPAVSEANILCLGNFDGVHMAHRTLLHRAKQLQTDKLPNARVGVFCFEKPSTYFLSPNPPAQLTTLEQKLKFFADEGMDFVFVADFKALQGLSPEEFINDILVAKCACKAAVCGFNYRFGKGGKGTPDLLQTILGEPFVAVQSVIEYNGVTVSSTRVRELLTQGKITEANALLTTPFSIIAPVEHGKGLGRHLGAPTINQIPAPQTLVPAYGVYLTRCMIDGQFYYGLTNIGIRPTVDVNATVNFETHLFDFEGDLYNKELCVEFLHYIRPEQRFENTEELQKQIQHDIKTAKELLK